MFMTLEPLRSGLLADAMKVAILLTGVVLLVATLDVLLSGLLADAMKVAILRTGVLLLVTAECVMAGALVATKRVCLSCVNEASVM